MGARRRIDLAKLPVTKLIDAVNDVNLSAIRAIPN